MKTRQAPDLAPGTLLAGRYRLSSLVARGGMAHVYRAHDERLRRDVAVKVLALPFAEDDRFVLRFSDEARAAASVSHPNLVHVYDAGTDAGVRFIVMELLAEARSLREELSDLRRLPPEEAVSIALEILAALDALHGTGRVHCDVKPANVMLDPGGVKLIDLGIARPLHAIESGSLSIGSLQAMAPEQLDGRELTPATDTFAVGVVLYEALTGEIPYPGSSPDEVREAQARGPAATAAELNPAVGPRLSDAVAQALRIAPGARFLTAAAMRNALAQAAASDAAERRPERGRAETRLVRTTPAATRLAVPGLVTLLALLAIVVLAGSVLAGAALLRTPDPSVVSVPVAAGALLTPTPAPSGPNDSPTAEPSAAPGTPTVAPTPTVAATPVPSTAPTAGQVAVPNTIGLSETAGESAAQQAGLNWTLQWRVAPGETPGIYAQDPAPGTPVAPGSRFVMYAYRSR